MENKQKKLRLSRADGLQLGRWFAEDPTLKIVEIPIGAADPVFDPGDVVKTKRKENLLRDNVYLQRLFNRVLAQDMFYGVLLLFASLVHGYYAGLIVIFVWSFIDLIFGGRAIKEEISHAR